MAKGRWTKQMWTRAALEAIARGGVHAVAVDTIAGDLGATRGSFYWHFTDRAALLDAALAAWEESDTTRVEQELTAIDDPRRRMRTLFQRALQDGDDDIPGLEPGIYAHPDHPAVAPVLRRVTERRIGILRAGYRDLGLTPARARRQAVITYATYIGWLQLRRVAGDLVPEVAPSGRSSAATIEQLVEQLIPGVVDSP